MHNNAIVKKQEKHADFMNAWGELLLLIELMEEEQCASSNVRKNDLKMECNRADEQPPLTRRCEIKLNRNEVDIIIARQQQQPPLMRRCEIKLNKNEVGIIIAQQKKETTQKKTTKHKNIDAENLISQQQRQQKQNDATQAVRKTRSQTKAIAKKL